MKSFSVLVCALALAFLTGCSGHPFESDGRSLMKKRVTDQSGSTVVLTGFKKVNGMLSDDTYEMEFEAEVLFPSSGSWQRGSALDSSVSFGFSPQQQPQNAAASLMAGAMGIVNVKAGERKTVKGVLRFEKTEKGWRGEDGQVY